VIGLDAHDAVLASAKTGMASRNSRAVIERGAAAEGRSGRTAAGADHRLVVRQLRRRRDAGAGRQRDHQDQGQILLMASGALTWSSELACSRQVACPGSAGGGRGRLRDFGHQGTGDAHVGDTVTLASSAATGRCRVQEVKPQVFAGLFPVESNQYEALRDALTKLPAQRCIAALRAEVRQALASGSAALPRPGCTGHRAGAARAEYDMDLITTGRRWSTSAAARRHGGAGREPVEMPDPAKIEEIASRSSGHDLRAAGVRRAVITLCIGQARCADRPRVSQPPRAPDLRAAAWRRSCWTSSTS